MLTNRIKRLEAKRIAAIPEPATTVLFLPKDEMMVSIMRSAGYLLKNGHNLPSNERSTGPRPPLTIAQYGEALNMAFTAVEVLITAGRLEDVEAKMAARGIPHVPREKWWPISESDCG